MKYIAGVDIGTTGTKVTIYTLEGHSAQSAYRGYSLQYGYGGTRVELNPAVWWDAVCDCFQEIVQSKVVQPSEIAAVGLSGTNAFIMLDGQGRPLCNAVMQLDRRAASTLNTIKSTIGEQTISSITGNRLAHGAFWGPTLYWFQHEDEGTYRQAKYFLVPHSFIVFKLTGEYTIDDSRAATTSLYDIHARAWNGEMCDYFGIDPQRLPEILQASEVAGTITPEAASQSGLRAGTPVVTGCMDTLAAHIGMNVGSQEASFTVGTVGRICAVTSQCDIRFMNTPYMIDNEIFSMAPVNAAGLSHRWIKALVLDDPHRGNGSYAQMDELAMGSSPGARGILYHPYISGERSPIWDPWVSGSFFGLSAFHGKGDVIRAVMEGVGFAFRHNLTIYEQELMRPIDILRAGGGGVLSAVWMQTLSNILRKSIVTCEVHESETLGSAILAAVGVGYLKSLTEGMQTMVRQGVEYSPDDRVREIYEAYFKVYKDFYEANRGLYERLYKLRVKSSFI